MVCNNKEPCDLSSLKIFVQASCGDYDPEQEQLVKIMADINEIQYDFTHTAKVARQPIIS